MLQFSYYQSIYNVSLYIIPCQSCDDVCTCSDSSPVEFHRKPDVSLYPTYHDGHTPSQPLPPTEGANKQPDVVYANIAPTAEENHIVMPDTMVYSELQPVDAGNKEITDIYTNVRRK